MIEQQLSVPEYEFAVSVGVKRQIEGLLKGRKPTHGAARDQPTMGWYWNISGACGEYVIAKWLGVEWTGARPGLPWIEWSDVGELEVRTTLRHNYPMKLHPTDKDSALYFHVTGHLLDYQIHGCIRGRHGKNNGWFHDRPPPANKPTGRKCFWVPADALSHKLEELKDWYFEKSGAKKLD